MPDIRNYRQARQEADFWCWAAVSVSLSRYYARGAPSQCEFVKLVIQSANCPNTMFSLAGALSKVPCLAAPPLNGTLALEPLRNQLAFGFPVCLRLRLDTGLGHVVVAVGCSSEGLVKILDPAREGSVDVPYSLLVNGGYRGAWVDTCLTS